jgi:DNA primase
VALVFDPDRAGQEAALRTAVTFLDAGIAVRVAVLPPEEDPDLFLRKHGADAFRDLLAKAVSAVQFQVAVLSQREDPGSEVGAMRIARDVLQTIRHSPNAVQRVRLIEEASRLLGLPAAALENELQRSVQRARRGVSAPPEAPGARRSPSRPKEEVSLCEHMVRAADYPSLVGLVRKYLPLDMLSDPVCRNVVAACVAAVEKGEDLHAALQDFGDESGETQSLAASAQMAPVKIKGNEKAPEDAVRDIILYIWRKKMDGERSGLAKDGAPKAGSPEEARCRQITYDLKALGNWETGSAILDMELSR